MEDPDLQETGDPQGPTHSRSAEYGSRQTIQARPDHPDRVVSPSRGLPVDMPQMAPDSNRPVCIEVQQVTSVCVTSSRLPRLGSRCMQSTLGGPGSLCLPISDQLGKAVVKLRGYICSRIILIVQDVPTCTGSGIT